MAKPEAKYAFISVFYAREQWHQLIRTVRMLLLSNELMQSTDVNVFLSTHQGTSVRIAIQHTGEQSKKKIQKLINGVSHFMEQNPSRISPVKLPVRSFFTDFPNNVIKYNLFNERSFMPVGLRKFQAAISQLLLTFFDDHEVDDDALFTLIVTLTEAFLNGIYCDEEITSHLIEQLIRVLKQEQREHFFPEIADHFRPVAEFNNDFNFEETIHWLEEASFTLAQEIGNKVDAYCCLLRMMKLHLLKVDNGFFVAALQYLANAMEELHCKRHRYGTKEYT